VRRNLGDEVFFRLIEPFCSGVYAGDPTKLSMKAAFGKVYDLELKGGSIIGGVLKIFSERRANPPAPRDATLPPKPAGQTVGSFRKGLATLPAAMAAKLGGSVRCGWALTGIEKEAAPAGGGEMYRLSYDTPEGRREVRARAVALTVPSYTAAELIKSAAPAAAAALESFDYPPVAAVTLAYPEAALRPDRLDAAGRLPGFGQLHPRTQGVTTLGTIYSSSLFPDRAPPGEVLLLSYFGGALNRGVVAQEEDDIVRQVDLDLKKMLLRADAPPPRKLAVRVWPRAIPQFNVGHGEKLEAARRALDAAGWGGVMLGGNYVAGVALGKCVEFGYEWAGRVAARAAAARATAP
jgi:oxygen-dependent protoporphyrinogen oxidase